MKNILIITGRYLPGFKDGGPVRTLKNLTDSIGERFNFTIACADRDHGDAKPYDNISVNDFNKLGKANVYYVKNGRFSFSKIKKLSSANDIVYVCGVYNSYAIKALILKRLGLIKKPFVLAPMGSFSKGALQIKSLKKQVYFATVKAFGLFKKINFSVTSDIEEEELREALNITNKCYVAEDPQRSISPEFVHSENKKDGITKIVFISRICQKKNLHDALRILSKVRSKAVFHIYGNIEDKEYFERAKGMIVNLPTNITCEYKGEIPSEEVPNVMKNYDIFLFPTFGENFGHVISEALATGTIPVISNTTPWNDLNEKNSGFVIDLSDMEMFVNTIENICKMEPDEMKIISDNARNYYLEKYNNALENNGYIKMFDEL